MLAKTLILAAASAVVASAYSIPSCWETCFEKYNIQSEGCLCSAPLEQVVTSCISVGCPANNATSSAGAYEAWLQSYCSSGVVTTTDITTAYTTVCPVTESTGTWYSTSTIQTSWATTWSTPVTTAYTSGWSTWTATLTPGVNTWTAPLTTAPATTGWATTPATTPATSWPTTTPPPYVAGAAGLKVGGVLGAVAAVAGLVL